MKHPHKLRSKILIASAWLFCVSLLFCAKLTSAYAQQQKFPAYTGHVNDFANVMDSQTKERLETILTNFERMTGAQIAAVYVPSLNDRPVEDYAESLYETWGIGGKSGANKNKGALLLVSIGDRKTRLETGYGLEGDMPDGLAGELIRRMRPGLQQGQYSQAMEIGVRSIVDTLAEKWNVNVAGIENRQYAYRGSNGSESSGGGFPLLIFGAIFLFFIVMSFISRGRGGRGGGGGGSNLWWLAPMIFNRGGGSFGGGSWGSSGGGGESGGSSGGSDWGGFSGGDSGGGGASDSW